MKPSKDQHRLMSEVLKAIHPSGCYSRLVAMPLSADEMITGYSLLTKLLEDMKPPEQGKEAATASDEQWNRYLEELLGDIDAKEAVKLSCELQIVTSLARRHRQMGRIWSKDRLVAAVRHLMSGNAEVSDSFLPTDKSQTGQVS